MSSRWSHARSFIDYGRHREAVSNLRMEPSRLPSCAIMPTLRAPHSEPLCRSTLDTQPCCSDRGLNVDYDLTNIPAAYDRGRSHGPQALRLWMDALSVHLPDKAVGRILDLGCGTGRFSEALAAHFDADVLAIDPSMKMLDRACEKRVNGRVHYGRGRAEAIPLASESVDIIFMSMSFHHFTDPLVAALECHRVLREHGITFVRTGTREQIPFYPYVPFFPASRPILDQVLPTTSRVREVFEAAGFRVVHWEVITQTVALDYWSYADKLSAGGDSVLASLTPQDLRTGLDAVRSHAGTGDTQPIIEPIDLFVFRYGTA
jgi:ubiquinone/menaquinone biosynthesis C-methylase UbiE